MNYFGMYASRIALNSEAAFHCGQVLSMEIFFPTLNNNFKILEMILYLFILKVLFKHKN